jgi:hypothetical protein
MRAWSDLKLVTPCAQDGFHSAAKAACFQWLLFQIFKEMA